MKIIISPAKKMIENLETLYKPSIPIFIIPLSMLYKCFNSIIISSLGCSIKRFFILIFINLPLIAWNILLAIQLFIVFVTIDIAKLFLEVWHIIAEVIYFF